MATITVTGTFHQPSGSGAPITGFVRFVRRFAPQVVGSVVATGQVITAIPDASGVVTQTLLHGEYYVYAWDDAVPWDKGRFLHINVGETPSTQDVKDIAVGSVILSNEANVRAVTLAELRARTFHEERATVRMAYYSTFGDGGAGNFTFYESSTATDDSGLSCVKPTDIDSEDPGRWLRDS